VGGIRPSDGIAYDAQTTIQGYLDKHDDSDREFRVDSTMLRLIAARDFGRWGASSGSATKGASASASKGTSASATKGTKGAKRSKATTEQTLPVNFLTNHDITGGNSGSPVLDAQGRLVGLAFDGNREGMAGDVFFHPTLSKTVCVDIRFVLWIIEKYGKAPALLDEMVIRE
jgi:hypothetical protein